jgi:hypothetical protein
MSKLYRALIGFFAGAVALIGISGIPAFKNADHGWKWVVGGVGWFGGWVCGLVAVVLAVYALSRAALRRLRAA